MKQTLIIASVLLLSSCALHKPKATVKPNVTAGAHQQIAHTTYINQKLNHSAHQSNLDTLLHKHLVATLKKHDIASEKQAHYHINATVSDFGIRSVVHEPLPTELHAKLAVNYELSAKGKIFWQRQIKSKAVVSFQNSEHQNQAMNAALKFALDQNLKKMADQLHEQCQFNQQTIRC